MVVTAGVGDASAVVVEALLHGRHVLASDFAMEGFPPEVREMVTVVDVEAPVIPAADRLDRPDIRHPHLMPFTERGFDERVAQILAVLLADRSS